MFYPQRVIFILTILTLAHHSFQAAEKGCSDSISRRRYLHFYITVKKNDTGHWLTDYSVEKSSPDFPRQLRVDVKRSSRHELGNEVFQIKGRLSESPLIPNDYHLYPGIGYYKLHTNKVPKFDDAVEMCRGEGGHLAIANSKEEASVFKSLLNAHKIHAVYSGFHDRIQEGQFMTIFGTPLNATGFYTFYPGQPDDHGGNEDCGCFREEGLLCDLPCIRATEFICEYDLTWADDKQ
ncbi:hemolymph lipopolysaccharide-binding protein-like [Ischnura elegans]|uniref:hemolymph lipopolysaccharide-binding protein-like n=1 Tax=Ischnura elegans TaxID=197161 RepID=UPI001ED8717A|nr:hemolymph lipopolysaccharide-binding protein-like [Ischnura elegans]